MADDGLYFFLQGSRIDLKEAYLAYRRSCVVDLGDQVFLAWFPYVSLSSAILDISPREFARSKRTAIDIQAKE